MPEEPKYVTMVCTANVCRSPMAAKLLEHALAAEAEPLRSLKVISTGVASWDGTGATPQAVKAMEKVGLDITNHRSRALTGEIMDNSLAVFCMTESHKNMVRKMFPDKTGAPIFLVREFMPAGVGREIPDPYGATLDVYEECRDSIVEAVPSLVKFLKALTAKK